MSSRAGFDGAAFASRSSCVRRGREREEEGTDWWVSSTQTGRKEGSRKGRRATYSLDISVRRALEHGREKTPPLLKRAPGNAEADAPAHRAAAVTAQLAVKLQIKPPLQFLRRPDRPHGNKARQSSPLFLVTSQAAQAGPRAKEDERVLQSD